MARTTITITFEDGETASRTINILEPQFEDGWWSYDKDGKERYEWGEDKISIPLGKTMYFNVKTKDIVAGEELEMQLMDYDYFWWLGEHIDEYNIDTSKFPNDTVWKKAKVRAVDGQSIATVELLLEDSWEPVIANDNDNPILTDKNIELYWRVRYVTDKGPKVKKILPQKKEDYLRVGYNDRDLFLKPITQGVGLPEFYTNDGKLIIFAFKMAEKIADAYIPNPYLSSFSINTVRITETQTLSSINKVKRSLLYERVNWDTNESVRYGYQTKESTNFIIKGKASWKKVNEFETISKKKFSDYFNHHDVKNGVVVGLKYVRKAIRVLDFINAFNTVTSIFKQPEEGLQIPKPSSVISAMGLIGAIKAIPGFGALTPLFLAGDVITTKVVNEIINEFTEDSLLAWERAKQGGLNTALIYVQHSQGAKMIELSYKQDISQEQYEKMIKNEFVTFREFDDFISSKPDLKDNYYTCFYYLKIEGERKKYIIDSIFIQ